MEDGRWTPGADSRAFFLACMEGRAEDAKRMLATDRSLVFAADSRMGLQAIHVAAGNDHAEIVEMLLEGGADVNARMLNGGTPLAISAGHGFETVSATLLAQPNVLVDGLDHEVERMPLTAAAKEGHAGIAAMLLAHGARVDGVRGTMPLALAAQGGHADIVSMLLEKGVDVNSVSNMHPTALLLAAQNGHARVVAMLLANGVDVNLVEPSNRTSPLAAALNNGHAEVVSLLLTVDDINVNLAVGNEGIFPLLIAMVKRDLESVWLLLEKGANVNALTTGGYSPLIAAAELGLAEVVSSLLAKGADVHKASENGSSSLLFAAEKGHAKIVEMLLAKGADIHTRAVNGTTPLGQAAQEGHTEIVSVLLAHGADVNATSSLQDGVTPLFLAAACNRIDVVQMLLAAGAAMETTYGELALHIASRGGHSEVVRVLCAAGAPVDAMDTNGCTALVSALLTRGDHVEVVRALLDAGASPHTHPRDDVPVLTIASLRSNPKCVAELISRGADVGAACGSMNNATALHAAVIGLADAEASLTDEILMTHVKQTEEGRGVAQAALAGDVAASQKLRLVLDNARQEALLTFGIRMAAVVDTVDVLCKAGAPVDAVDGKGLTALQITRLAPVVHSELVDVLLRYGALDRDVGVVQIL